MLVTLPVVIVAVAVAVAVTTAGGAAIVTDGAK